MKKIYIIIYTILFVCSFVFLTYIGIYDSQNNTRAYVSCNDITLWDDYQLQQKNNTAILNRILPIVLEKNTSWKTMTCFLFNSYIYGYVRKMSRIYQRQLLLG